MRFDTVFANIISVIVMIFVVFSVRLIEELRIFALNTRFDFTADVFEISHGKNEEVKRTESNHHGHALNGS